MNSLTFVIRNACSSMKVNIDKHSGFCPGVVQAINTAEKYLKMDGQLYCLGEIVHNELEVERLEKLGMKTIGYDEFMGLKNARVLLRSHGEAPETYEVARQNNIELIDATCGIVINVQKKVRKASEKGRSDEGQVVIFGKPKHPEVISLNGQTGRSAIIIEKEEDLEQIDYQKPVRLFSQTTMQTEKFERIREIIAQRMKENKDMVEFESLNTICKQVSNRVPRLEDFARENDVLIFVSGKQSSNGKFLFEMCKSFNENSYFVSGKNELDPSWFERHMNIGITGATSTPEWLLEEIAQEIKGF